jgi:diguanylate cyclase (GGDEF)-like protein
LSAERKSDAEIKRLAMFDSLTGLANRARMHQALDQMIMQLERVNRPVALFMLDLDRFKAVNDTLGHQTGDALLKIVAQRLERTVGQQGLVGRLGGDEFQVILSRYNNHAELKALADSIIYALSQPYFIGGSTITIGCSIGIAMAPDHARDAETLVRNSDLALYAAKAGGRGNRRFFQEELLTQARSRKAMEDDLRMALERGEFSLVYQPVVSTADAQVVGYEALLRWDHPRGRVSPAEFIPVAEDSGLIHQIGEWVLRTACSDAASWPAPARVAVNVSPIQFMKAALPAIVTGALAQSGIDPDRLELEITEGVFLNEDSSTVRMIEALKQTGLRLVLDDFGTGYSSLAYLKKAPFDKVKIDQSFVRGAAHDTQNRAIIRAVVAMADTLGLETTAEGVETQDEIALIAELGCSHIQGFVYGQPVPLAKVQEQLAAAATLNPVGLKVSRPARVRLLRSAFVRAGGAVGPARIRDISPSGLMIDAYKVPLVAGQSVSVEIVDGPQVAALVRWVRDGRAGLELTDAIDLTALSPKPTRTSVLRRS